VKRAIAIAITGKLVQVVEGVDRRLGMWAAYSEIVEVVARSNGRKLGVCSVGPRKSIAQE
jgi:hypothetical protein